MHILEVLFVIIIFLATLAICFLLIYWGVSQIYKSTIKPKVNDVTEIKKKLDSLEERMESLERKIDQK